MGLNSEQQRAVDCTSPLIVLAPPGSGKTGTLVAKTKHILSQSPEHRVMLVTFTDASSKEAKERIAKAVGTANLSRVLVATFHSHAMNQLRRANRLGRILSPHESQGLVRQALRNIGSDMDLIEADGVIQHYKSNPAFSGTEDELVKCYEQLKRSHRALDFQDVIRECVNGMRAQSSDELLAPLPCTHLLCDEFQDVDLNQLNWLLCYHDIGVVVTAVGDDDQSIYGWRSSMGYEAVDAFIKSTNSEVINLEVNYRSNVEILQCAERVIKNNAKRMPKTLISAKGEGGGVSQVQHSSKETEADYVLKLILEDVEERRDGLWVKPGRWGIIARNNRDLWFIAGKLRSHGIPVKAGKKDPAPAEVMNFCAFLASLCNSDSLGLAKCLDDIGLQPHTLKKLRDGMGEDFSNLLDGDLPTFDMPIEDKRLLSETVPLFAKWRRMLQADAPPYSRIIGAVGTWYCEAIKLKEDTEKDFMDFVNILSSAKGSITSRIQAFFRQTEPKGEAGVTILTMHGSKGLEYDRVYLAQCNAGTIPSAKTHSTEEERRLFYVAMTRAREDLHIGWIASKGPSVFISET